MTTTYRTTTTGIQYASIEHGHREVIISIFGGSAVLTDWWEGREHVEDGEVVRETLREAWRVAVGEARRWARGETQ